MTHEEFTDFCENDDIKDYFWICQENMDIGGGKITFDDIDRQCEFGNIDKVMISGLYQDTFEYFIKKHGHKSKYINFFKDKMIEDFSILSELTEVQYIKFFHNQRATKLWNMSFNYKLKGLCFDDFTKLHSLDGIQTAPNLEYLHFGDKIWNTSTLTDINALENTNLVSFSFRGKAIDRNDISIYTKMPSLLHLDFASNFYNTEEIAQIIAECPNVSGYALRPYIKFDFDEVLQKDVLICGKRKPFLDSKKDMNKIRKYSDKFYALVDHYKKQSSAD